MRARWCFVLLLAGTLLAGPAFGQLREVLGDGDTVRVTVFQNPELTTETRISERGTISFPLVGEVELAGLTRAAAEARIAARLKDGQFVRNPQVGIELVTVRSRQVSVLGQVARPGRYALDGARMTLTDVLALAGGIAPAGDDTVTVVTRRGGKPETLHINVPAIYRSGLLAKDIALESGDAVFVPRAPVFYIYGEVQRPGMYRLEPGMTVMQALSVGGGLTPRGTERGLQIRRNAADGEPRTIAAGLSAKVDPEDVIFVKESLF